MKLSIRLKLCLVLIGLTLFFSIITIISLDVFFLESFKKEGVQEFERIEVFYQNQEIVRYNALVEMTLLISQNNVFHNGLIFDDPKTFNQIIESEYSVLTQLHLFVVTDKTGKVLNWIDRPDLVGTNISHRKSITDALNGIQINGDGEWPELWKLNNELYQVASMPIFEDDSINGTITLGTIYNEGNAELLTKGTPLEIMMFVDDHILARSDSSMGSSSQVLLSENLKKEISKLFRKGSLKPTEPIEATLNNKDIFGFISPLGNGEKAYYIAYVPFLTQFETLNNMQNKIIQIGIISILLIIPVSIVIAKFLSNPINSLTDAMLQVQKGNLNVSVKPTSNDEIGVLSQTFNKMIHGLRERAALKKYVGGFTLSLVRDEKNYNIQNEENEVAILFSDIRASTKLIGSTSSFEYVTMLNKTFSSQTESIINHNGSVNKFAGDSIVAIFNGEDAIKRSIDAAIEIQKKFYSDKEVSDFFEGLGIGINYGKVVFAHLGTKSRMDYTIIGQNVNLCSRLCSRAQSGQILLVSHTAKSRQLNNSFDFESIGDHSLKGFSKKLPLVKIVY